MLEKRLEELNTLIDSCESEMANVEAMLRSSLSSGSADAVAKAAVDSSPLMRRVAWSLNNWFPTCEQVEVAIRDEDLNVRINAWKNPNWVPTSAFLKNKPVETDPEIIALIMAKERQHLKTKNPSETKREAIQRYSNETL